MALYMYFESNGRDNADALRLLSVMVLNQNLHLLLKHIAHARNDLRWAIARPKHYIRVTHI